jgi:hypothetical protein
LITAGQRDRLRLEVSKMKREFVVLFVIVFLIAAWIPGKGICGYSMSSEWRSDSQRFWYIIEVVSGSPPPFRDLHVETGDADPSNYLLAKAPEGWQMSIVPKNDGSGDAWINFYGDLPCTAADIRVEYSGDFAPKRYSVWLLTDDGDPDPGTGAIPGENGDDAYGAWPPCENLDVKVGVHVIPHEDRTCFRDFPAITSCSDIVATCAANDVDFFPVFYDLCEYKAVEYSVEWPGTYSCVFTACSYSNFGTIRWPAGSVPSDLLLDHITQAYEHCQLGTAMIPGWGWIYEPGPATIRIVPNVESGRIGVLNCDQSIDEPICNFAAGIGGATGEEPCGPSAAEPSTWGAIKAMFD